MIIYPINNLYASGLGVGGVWNALLVMQASFGWVLVMRIAGFCVIYAAVGLHVLSRALISSFYPNSDTELSAVPPNFSLTLLLLNFQYVFFCIFEACYFIFNVNWDK